MDLRSITFGSAVTLTDRQASAARITRLTIESDQSPCICYLNSYQKHSIHEPNHSDATTCL